MLSMYKEQIDLTKAKDHRISQEKVELIIEVKTVVNVENVVKIVRIEERELIITVRTEMDREDQTIILGQEKVLTRIKIKMKDHKEAVRASKNRVLLLQQMLL